MGKEKLIERLRDSIKEYCIICGKETSYQKTDNILLRKYYVEGAGQLCKKCYFLIYYGEKSEGGGDT